MNAINNDFQSVFNEWLDTANYAEGSLNKMKGYKRELIAVLGNKPITDITVPDLMLVLKPVEKAGNFAKLKKIRTIPRFYFFKQIC